MGTPQPRPRDAGTPEPAATGSMQALWRLLDQMPRRRERDLLRLFIEKRRLADTDFARLLGTDYGNGNVTSRIYWLRKFMAGSGWHIEALGSLRYELREGDDPVPRGAGAPVPPPVDEPLQPGEKAALLQVVGQGQQLRALLVAFCDRRRLSEEACAELLAEEGAAALRPQALIYELRRAIRPLGWYVFRVSPRDTPGIFELRKAGRDPLPAWLGSGKDAGGEEGGRPRKEETAAAVARPVDKRVIAGRRELTIKAAPGGCCQYLVVTDGKAVPCGAPSKGTYCAAHKAKSAGLEGTGGRW